MAFGFASPFQPGTALQGANAAAQRAAGQVAQTNSQWTPQVSGQAPATAVPAQAPAAQQPQAAGQQQSPYGLHLTMPQDGVNLAAYQSAMPQAAVQPAGQSYSSEFGDFMNRLANGGGHIISTLASLFGG